MRIAVDLTPILPGGDNGGAKIMTLQLIKELAKISPKDLFILLASEKNYAELSAIKAPNIKTINTSRPAISFINLSIIFVAVLAAPFLKFLLPGSIKLWLKNRYKKLHETNLSKLIKADLLFCPFTAPFFRFLNIPIVSVIYDLQSQYYPFFFTEFERYERKKNFDDACEASSKLVCISDFVKKTILENSSILSDKVKTIYIRLAHRLPDISQNKILANLKRFNLKEQNFLLFPANFWAHKNHQLLIAAFNIYCRNHPNSTLKLICTGSDSENKRTLQKIISELGMQDRIMMPGYLTDEEFASLVKGCQAIIFPSLYECFGMPLLEAMAAGKPVLCSDRTSLPEIAGNAALLFDPRKPDAIADAIKRIENEPDLIQNLIKLGKERLALFGSTLDMAKEYLEIFKEAALVVK